VRYQLPNPCDCKERWIKIKRRLVQEIEALRYEIDTAIDSEQREHLRGYRRGLEHALAVFFEGDKND
jgi:hypothetical protein